MPRRRIYILCLEDVLADHPPARRLRLRPRFLVAALLILGIAIASVTIKVSSEIGFIVPLGIGYTTVVLIFVALSKRFNRIE